jgi:hypothetical protein
MSQYLVGALPVHGPVGTLELDVLRTCYVIGEVLRVSSGDEGVVATLKDQGRNSQPGKSIRIELDHCGETALHVVSPDGPQILLVPGLKA